MKAIIYFGNLGTTAKAATLLGEKLTGCSIYDGTKKFFLDYSLCEELIFGVNIRMGKLNRKFVKFYKKLKKQNINCSMNAFLIGADFNKRSTYLSQMEELLPEDARISFFGGDLNLENAKGLSRKVISACIEDFEKKQLPLPSLSLDAIEAFADRIEKKY